MGRRSLGAAVAALCVLSLVVAAAAGASRAGAPTLTAAAYRAGANAICKNEEKELNAVPSGVTLAAYLASALKIAHRSYVALKQLAPPTALARLNAQVVANINAGFPIVSRLLERAKAGKLTLAQFEHDKELNANVAAEDALWKQLGAKVCAGA